MRKYFILIISLFLIISAAAQKRSESEKIYDLELSQEDIVLLPEDDAHRVKDGNGAHLFVRKRGDIQSIALLVECDNYNDPDLSLMRAKERNEINGNEERFINGNKSSFRMERTPNALISSTIEKNFLGECFHIYIPKEMYYGYVIQVQDECIFEDGMKVSVRAFSQKHCDAGGKFLDNMLFLNLSDWQLEESFAKIASLTEGNVIHVEEAARLPEKLFTEIEEFEVKEKVEVIFAIDATGSMKDDFLELKKNWLPKFKKQMKKFEDARIGLLFYKDYGENFNSKGLPVKNMGFFKNTSAFIKAFKNISVSGGGDKNEAVYEALYSAVKECSWNAQAKKKIILIGDAAPHEYGKTSFGFTFPEIISMLNEKNISVDCFLISNSSQSNSDMKSIKKDKSSEELIKSVEVLDAK